MEKLKRSYILLRSLVYSLWGLVAYFFTQKTPQKSFLAMINLFCMSKGRTNTFASNWVNRYRGRYQFNANKTFKGILGDLHKDTVDNIAQQIDRDGFYVFEQALSAEHLKELVDFSLSTPADVLVPEGEKKQEQALIYDPKMPAGLCYDFNPVDLCHTTAGQSILIDESLLAVSQAYLGCKPVVEQSCLRWTTEVATKASVDAAQLFHFDMDRLKWLKFFIYLTDVTMETGPHVFVRGSHRDKKIPASILKQGYARVSDAEVLKYFDKEDVMHFTGKAGKIIAVDTRGLHKGLALEKGHRLLFQIQHSNSLYGGAYQKLKIKGSISQSIQRHMEKFKASYPMYV